MRDKILQALILKYVGLNKNMLGAIADKLTAKVTDEAAIEGAIAELDNLPIPLTEFGAILQREGDTRATQAVESYKAKNPGAKPPKTEPEPNPGDPENPLAKQLAELAKKLEKMEAEKTQSTLKEQLHAKMKEKGIPLVLAKNISIDSAEALDEVLTGLETDFTAIKQETTNSDLSQNQFVPGGGVNNTSNSSAVLADIASWAKSNNPQTT